MSALNSDFRGIGMTSQRSRDRLARRLRDSGIASREVLRAISDTPRHIFIDEALASRAYDDTALPIGHGQTISQPYIVARMTEALLQPSKTQPSKTQLSKTQPGNTRRVLEIGAGCGYQTAILARLVPKVYSIERIAALLSKARERLAALGCDNIETRHGDGGLGWPEQAPFDGILVAAAAVEIPPALPRQLAPHGRLIIPVGGSASQELLRVTRTADGFAEERLARVSFVPMIHGERD